METGSGSAEQRTTTVHVLLFPFPALGHVICTLKLAELLSLAGLDVTFLNSDYNHRCITRFSASYARLSHRPGFSFRSIPDGLPEDQPRSASRIWHLLQSLSDTQFKDSFRDLLVACKRSEPKNGWPPVTCVIADGILPFAVDIAEGLGIPALSFRTCSPCSIWSYLCIPDLIRSGELPFPGGADLDEPIRSVQGMESFLRRRDLASIMREATDAADSGIRFLSTVTADASRARAVILNTFEFLDAPLLARIRTHWPVIYAVGPLHSLVGSYDDGLTPSASMWEEDRTCMAWLDAQPDRSVVYVSFGSLAVVSPEEMVEFWHGLVNSGQRFLWVVRPGLVGEGEGEGEGGQEMTLPPVEVEEATKERGCMVGWVPQAEVLAHPAVGCFLTHSGWNSTLESITAGVPMICWPFFADQLINSRFVSEVWRVGLDMKDRCGRRVVEKMVREAMEGDKAEELRRSASEAAEMARRSVAEGGPSYIDLKKLIQHITSLSSEANTELNDLNNDPVLVGLKSRLHDLKTHNPGHRVIDQLLISGQGN